MKVDTSKGHTHALDADGSVALRLGRDGLFWLVMTHDCTAALYGCPMECRWADEEAGEIEIVVKDGAGKEIRRGGGPYGGEIVTALVRGDVKISYTLPEASEHNYGTQKLCCTSCDRVLSSAGYSEEIAAEVMRWAAFQDEGVFCPDCNPRRR